MPILKNPKHERFAQERAQGKTADEAFVLAGYSENRGNAARLNTNESVSARIEQILSDAAKSAGVTVQSIMAELAKLGFANIADYVDMSGPVPIISLECIPRDKMAAISEITTKTAYEGRGDSRIEIREVRIKLWDKRASLVDLGRHLGMFKDKLELTGQIAITHEEALKALEKDMAIAPVSLPATD